MRDLHDRGAGRRHPLSDAWQRSAEGDPIAAGAEDFLDRLACPTTLIRFSAPEGAGDHCELMNRWLANQRILDWLDDLFA